MTAPLPPFIMPLRSPTLRERLVFWLTGRWPDSYVEERLWHSRSVEALARWVEASRWQGEA